MLLRYLLLSLGLDGLLSSGGLRFEQVVDMVYPEDIHMNKYNAFKTNAPFLEPCCGYIELHPKSLYSVIYSSVFCVKRAI